jgi:MFS family permease
LQSFRQYIIELHEILSGNVAVIAISWFLFSLTSGLVNPFFAKYAKDLGATDLDVAYMRSIGMLALALSLIPGGLLADYIGRAKTIIIGTACITVSQYLYAVAPDWRILFYTYVFDQASHFYQPALTAIVMDSIPRGREFKGFLALNMIMSIPGIFMPFIGGVLYEKLGVFGIRCGFILQGFVALIVLILRIKSLKETYKARDKELSSLILELAGYRPVLAKALKVYIYTSILQQVAVSVSATYGAIYAIDVLGVSKPFWGIVSSVSTTGSLISSILLLRTRSSARGMTIVSSLGIATSQLILALPYYERSTVLGSLVVSSLVGSVSSNILWSSISAMLTHILPIEVRGRALSIQRILDNIGASLASYIAGVLYVIIGPGVALIITGLVGLISTLYLYILVKGK